MSKVSFGKGYFTRVRLELREIGQTLLGEFVELEGGHLT